MVELNSSYGMVFSLVMVILLIINVISGYRKGLFATVLNLVRVILSVVIAFWLSKPLADAFPIANFKTDGLSNILVSTLQTHGTQIVYFILVYLVCMLLTGFMIKIMKGLNKVPLVGSLNQVFGAIIGFGIGWLQCGIVLVLLFSPLFKNSQQAVDNSTLKVVQTSLSWLDQSLKSADFNRLFSLSSSLEEKDLETQLRELGLSQEQIREFLEGLKK